MSSTFGSWSIGLLVAGVLVAAPAAAAPLWLGPWLVDPPPPQGLAVTRPDTGVPGASLRVAPTGKGPAVGLVRATFDFVDTDFDSGHAVIELAAAPTAVHAQVRVDGQVVAMQTVAGRATLALPHGRRVILEVQALDATQTAWNVTLHGLVFHKSGWTLVYSHDMAGLRAVAEGPDAVRLAVDPDWAELGWPLAGTVAATRQLRGRVLTGNIGKTLPDAGMQALLSVDDVPRLVPQAGALALDVTGGRELAVILHAAAAMPGKAKWHVELTQLRLDDAAVADPTAPTPTAAGDVAPLGLASGCAAARGPGASAAGLLLALAGLAVACWRRARRGGTATCSVDC
jgi:hypothetical protein